MANNRLYPFWGHLTTALPTGLPQDETRDGSPDPFAAIYAEPARLKEFLEAMTGVHHGANLTFAHEFPWTKYPTVVDVGTAQGLRLTQVALANPHLEGIGFDLPQVEPIFEEYIESNRQSGRVKFISGSFMEQPLPKAEVIIMGHILHDWDLETKRMLVQKSFAALPDGGGYIVHESIIDEDRSVNSFGLLMSLNMLVETSGGFDYTGADCTARMTEAGFRETGVRHLVGPDPMAIGIK